MRLIVTSHSWRLNTNNKYVIYNILYIVNKLKIIVKILKLNWENYLCFVISIVGWKMIAKVT